MLKHNKKVAAGNNKKKVRYGPVRYVNLKLDEVKKIIFLFIILK